MDYCQDKMGTMEFVVTFKNVPLDLLNMSDATKKVYEEWVEFIGGESNVFLKEFLSGFRLA